MIVKANGKMIAEAARIILASGLVALTPVLSELMPGFLL
jgi:hypothetical protein